MQDIPCNIKILLFPPEPQETFVYYHTEAVITSGNVKYSGSSCFPVTVLAESLRIFSDLAVGETAAPACFLRENAEGEGMPPLLSY